MPGQIKEMITRLIRLRVGDNVHMEAPLKIKLIMKGIDPDLYDENSADDPVVIQRLRMVAENMGHTL